MIPDLSGAFRGEAYDSFLVRGSETAVVLIHGFPGTPAEMRQVATAFQHQGWTTQGLLLPGFGKELSQLANRSKSDWLEAIQQAIHGLRQDHDKILLCGNSMGGALALATASQIPVDGLILFAPFWGISHILWHGLPVMKRIFPSIKPFRIFKPNFSDPAFRESLVKFMPDTDFDDLQVQNAITQLALPIKVFDEIRQVGKLGFAGAQQVTCPTLIFQGKRDELVRPMMTQQLMQQFRGDVVYHEIDAGHDMIEDMHVWGDIEVILKHFLMHDLIRS